MGEPQNWEGYDTLWDYGYFSGMYAGSSLQIATCGWFESELGPGKGQGTMNMNDGTVNIGGNLALGGWEQGGWEQTIGTLNMSGGTININQGLCCPLYPWGATGRLNLTGGTINARYMFMNDFTASDSGSIDIAGGKIILSRGNEVEELTDYSNGIGLGGAGSVSLTAYGVGDGDIITDSNYGAEVGKRADLSIDYDVSNEGKTTLQAFTTDPNQAWNPSPPNGAGNVKGTIANIARPILSWSPGDNATSHEVYFDSNEALVSARDLSVRKQTTYDPCTWTVDSDLTSLATYYWAIDENPGPTLGQVWSFTMANLSKAGLPSPGNGETDVNPIVNPSWASGIMASTHDVYFSTDFNDVNNRLISPFNTGATTSYDPPGNGLDFLTTYYWRIDEVNAAGGPQWPGDLWGFTTSDHIVVEDFDSYPDVTALRAVWKDRWTGSISKNQAEVFVETNADLVIGGNSMRYYYRNFEMSGGKPVGCTAVVEDTVNLEVGSDWTASGVEALVLNFRGDTANGQEPHGNYTIANDRMWVALEDGSANDGIVRLSDMNDVTDGEWHQWNIDLQDPCLISVDMNNVAKVYIGFGGRKGGATSKYGAGYTATGDTVWFDDIGLYPPRCVPEFSLATDFTGNCVVDEGDFDIMAGAWLMTDYNTIGYAGILRGFTTDVNDGNYNDCWVPGRIGPYALEFGVGHPLTGDSNCASGCYDMHTPQLDDDVLIPPLELNTNTLTFTCWVKMHGPQWP
ncbi:MAG: hypothetical protein ACYS21_17885, partial [Planctomycetota bacterium]